MIFIFLNSPPHCLHSLSMCACVREYERLFEFNMKIYATSSIFLAYANVVLLFLLKCEI